MLHILKATVIKIVADINFKHVLFSAYPYPFPNLWSISALSLSNMDLV